MSESDDTDLLLLIPPDFFLVHSPDLDSDCDSNFLFDHDEVKSSIVSDLITQVNDLESRICMIEQDRSITYSSSHIEDSFVDQSINSLTESDVLRTQIESKNKPLADLISNSNHMLESNEHTEKGSKQLAITQKQLSGLTVNNDSITDSNEHQNVDPTGIIENENTIKTNRIEYISGLTPTTSTIESPHQKEGRKELINEIDCYLEEKKKENNFIKRGEYEVKKVQLSHNGEGDYLHLNSNKSGFKFDSDQLHTEGINKQSLALPEVFDLLNEMEETQQEIEKKLKFCESDIQSERTSTDAFALHKTQNLDLEDLYSNNTNLSLNKQMENFHERLKYMTQTKYLSPDRLGNDSNTEMSYLFKPQINDELTFKKDFKSLSPNRGSLKFNPSDVGVANLPNKSGRNYTPHFENSKDVPGKISSFKRHLNFEHSDLSRNQTRPKSIYHGDEIKIDSLENPQKFGKLSVNRRSSISRQSLHHDGKHNSVSAQRVVTYKSNHNENPNDENKPSDNATIQHKLSSNNLLSLSELWNKEPSFYSDDPAKLRQKLEEEKYRRQHCEQQIQALQIRVLEEQERLAVAVKVDQEKDKAILQITESWRKLNNHWNELEEQRHSLAVQLQKEKESSKAKTDELMKKVERWEKEVSQALDLAAGYKEKSESVQKQMDSVKKSAEQKLDEANAQLFSLNKENEKIIEENKKLLEQLDCFRKNIDEEEKLLSKLKVELEKCKKKCSEYEAEINVLKEQKESLANKVKDEKGRNNVLEQQKNALQQAFDEAAKKEKEAQEEARVSNERNEVTRIELRALYQGQLEAVVKEKLQEFQCQLEAAEAALRSELQSKEKHWIEKANDQCKQLQEKHKLELHQKEELYKSEVTKWKVRLMESEKLRSASERKLEEETSRRADIAQRLHSVMETQWREALNIISNPMQNAYEVTRDENRSKWTYNPQSSDRTKYSGDLKASQSTSTTSTPQVDEVPFCREGVVTCRTTQPQQDQQLKKYIQMLLERGPGNPVLNSESLQESLDHSFLQESSGGNRYMLDNSKKSVGLDRFGHSGKPPWK